MAVVDTVLIVPAAGAGTRLESDLPKVLFPVRGRAMIDHLFERYGREVGRFVLVVAPAFAARVREHVARAASGLDVAYAEQSQPTGMLDAVLRAADATAERKPGRIWITWCDQIGVHPDTIARLAQLSRTHADAPAIFPTVRQTPPYIHFDRDADGRLTAVRQRREGDAMPEAGESDMGLFSLSASAYFDLLPEFAAEAARAAVTGERNLLPFFPWIARRGGRVITFAATDEMEAVGVNTADDRRRLETYLAERDRR